MTCATLDDHLLKEMLSTDLRSFCFNVIFPTLINFCVLMVAIPDSASVFWLSSAVFFYTSENPSVAWMLVAFYLFMTALIYIVLSGWPCENVAETLNYFKSTTLGVWYWYHLYLGFVSTYFIYRSELVWFVNWTSGLRGILLHVTHSRRTTCWTHTKNIRHDQRKRDQLECSTYQLPILSTYLLLKPGFREKKRAININWWVDLQLSWLKEKWVNSVVASNIFTNEWICLRKMKLSDLHKEIFDFVPQSIRNVCRFWGHGLWTVRTDHKIFDN